MTRARTSFGGVVLAAGLAAGVAGCVADGPSQRPLPRPLAAQPAGITPTVVDLAVAPTGRDSDQNGYADELAVTVFLFAPPHGPPLNVPGTFRFEVNRLDGEPLAAWTFEPHEAAQAVERTLPGPGYRFRLSLLDEGTDVMPALDAHLRCTFTPTGREPVRTPNPIRVSLGKIR